MRSIPGARLGCHGTTVGWRGSLPGVRTAYKNAQCVKRTTGGVGQMQKMIPSGIIAHHLKR